MAKRKVAMPDLMRGVWWGVKTFAPPRGFYGAPSCPARGREGLASRARGQRL